MGISGISLGGILAALTTGVDRRAKVLFTIVGGADVAYSLWHSPNMIGLRQGLIKNGYTYDSLKAAMAAVEPANYVQGFDPRNALLINGRYDVTVRPWQAEDLARALGGARIVWVDGGHYGVAFANEKIERVGAQFLRSRFFGANEGSIPRTLPSGAVKLGFLIGEPEWITPVLAYQAVPLDEKGDLSLDGQLTVRGLCGALSLRLNNSTQAGVEFPLFHGATKPRPIFAVTIYP
jgi:hypothetical protein